MLVMSSAFKNIQGMASPENKYVKHLLLHACGWSVYSFDQPWSVFN